MAANKKKGKEIYIDFSDLYRKLVYADKNFGAEIFLRYINVSSLTSILVV